MNAMTPKIRDGLHNIASGVNTTIDPPWLWAGETEERAKVVRQFANIMMQQEDPASGKLVGVLLAENPDLRISEHCQLSDAGKRALAALNVFMRGARVALDWYDQQKVALPPSE